MIVQNLYKFQQQYQTAAGEYTNVKHMMPWIQFTIEHKFMKHINTQTTYLCLEYFEVHNRNSITIYNKNCMQQ